MKISIRLDDEDVIKLKEYAQLRGITLSKLVREIVSEKLEEDTIDNYSYMNRSRNISEIC